MVHPIPDAVSFEDGAMMEPLSVGVHSVANLGEFKSDQVSHSERSEACHECDVVRL